MVGFWKFWAVRRNIGVLRSIISLVRKEEDAINLFQKLEGMLKRTQTQGTDEFGNKDIAFEAARGMVKSLGLLLKNGGDAIQNLLIIIHRASKEIHETDRIIVESGVVRNPLVRKHRVLEHLGESFREFIETTRKSRRETAGILEAEKTLAQITTVTNRRSALLAKQVSFELKAIVRGFSAAAKHVQQMSKVREGDKAHEEQLVKAIETFANSVAEFSGKSRVAMHREILVIAGANEYLNMIKTRLIPQLKEKGFPKKELETLLGEITTLEKNRIKILRKDAAMAHVVQMRDLAPLQSGA